MYDTIRRTWCVFLQIEKRNNNKIERNHYELQRIKERGA